MSRRRRQRVFYSDVKDEKRPRVLFELMIDAGYWNEANEIPNFDEVETLQKEVDKVNSELQEIQRQLGTSVDPTELRKKLLKERLKKSREERKKRQEERIKERERSAAEWRKKRQNDLISVGRGYSGLLKDITSDETKLGKQNLPILHNWRDLTDLLDIDLKTLRWMTYYRDVSTSKHYIEFEIPKRSGGTRQIMAPLPKLRKVQRDILHKILSSVEIHPAAHGFTTGRSILTNAAPHDKAQILINTDIKDFFPTITYPRVLGLFKSLGYSGHISTLLSLITTYTPRKKMKWKDKDIYVANGQRRLPQGAPTSPIISNLVCHRLDARLKRLAELEDINYTRYADDITLSIPIENGNGNTSIKTRIGKYLGMLRKIIRDEGFEINKKKTWVIRPHQRQGVTGLVINDGGARIPRPWLRKLRAILHNCKVHGIASQDRFGIGEENFRAMVTGMCSFVHMVDPDKGTVLLNVWNSIQQEA
jgi:hypothetical protein